MAPTELTFILAFIGLMALRIGLPALGIVLLGSLARRVQQLAL